MKSLFIVNPRSGIRRRADIADAIRHSCAGWTSEYEIARCEEKETLDELVAKAVHDQVEVVYAVGGDGTVHEVAKRLMHTPLALGIVPAGSGNGLARHLGIPVRTREALTACRDGIIATIDTAVVNELPYFGVMGIGLDAAIAERFGESRVRGLRSYVAIGLRTFSGYRPEEYEIEIDGAAQRRKSFVVAVANSSQYGNNARIAPLASLQDGLLDVVFIDDLSLLSAPRMLMRLFNGTFDRSSGVRILHGSQVTIRRAEAGPAHIDGEPLTLPAELDVRINPSSLRVLLPKEATRI